MTDRVKRDRLVAHGAKRIIVYNTVLPYSSLQSTRVHCKRKSVDNWVLARRELIVLQMILKAELMQENIELVCKSSLRKVGLHVRMRKIVLPGEL